MFKILQDKLEKKALGMYSGLQITWCLYNEGITGLEGLIYCELARPVVVSLQGAGGRGAISVVRRRNAEKKVE